MQLGISSVKNDGHFRHGRIEISDAGYHRRDVAFQVTVLARMLRSKFDRKVIGLNVTRSQWAMIAVVARTPGASQRMIAEVLEMTEASAGRLIDRLCADGLLERRERDDDRRAHAVHVTDAAAPLLAKLAQIAKENEQEMLAGIPSEDIDRLENLLNRVYENIARDRL